MPPRSCNCFAPRGASILLVGNFFVCFFSLSQLFSTLNFFIMYSSLFLIISISLTVFLTSIWPGGPCSERVASDAGLSFVALPDSALFFPVSAPDCLSLPYAVGRVPAADGVSLFFLSPDDGGIFMKSSSAAAVADNDGVIAAPFRIITAYAPKLRVELFCDPEEDRTQQSFRDDCDINLIMARYLKTGVLPQGSAAPQFVDTTAVDFLDAQELVARARGTFSLLSAEERDSYGNSVELWLDHQAMAIQEAQEAATAAAAAEKAATAAAALASKQTLPEKDFDGSTVPSKVKLPLDKPGK